MGSIGGGPSSLTEDQRRQKFMEGVGFHMDQQRWFAQYAEDCERVIQTTASPARKRSELVQRSSWMDKHRRNYHAMGWLQAELGLNTMEGQTYG